MNSIEKVNIEKMIGPFVREIFIDNVNSSSQAIECSVNVKDESWLMNEHFPGTSIIQCFFQCAMLLYYENDPTFDPKKSLFFLGDLKIKYKKPIFINEIVIFKMRSTCFMGGVLLYEGECYKKDGNKCTTISGSLSSKNRDIIPQKM